MRPADWLITLLPLLICFGITLYARKYVRSVADFMAGGRNAGRYLICAARGSQGGGVVVIVAITQQFFQAGFTVGWWIQILTLVGMVITISGWVVYRYRQTRALTLGQFFEMRYSRKFRIFCGALGFFSGLLNFGIIPVIGARFMVYFLELPQLLHLGELAIPTYLVLMFVFLSCCVLTTTLGGQITVLLTDCAESMFSQVFYLIVIIGLLVVFFNWREVSGVLLNNPPGKSLVNPFDTDNIRDFNLKYVLMIIVMNIYGIMGWQNSHAFNSSAATPHESRMGWILGSWRAFAMSLMVTLVGMCVLTYVRSDAGAAAMAGALANIKDIGERDQMQIPIALSHILPTGIKGALVAACIMGVIAGDGIHLHSWGSIFVQDVLLPLRKKPMSLEQHLFWLRAAIVFVAVFAFFFGWLVPVAKYISLWWMITQAVFTGGAGAAIIGGLYWKRGTAAGAWVGMIVGGVLSLGGILTELYFQHYFNKEFYLNGVEMAVIAMFCAATSYTVVSLLTCKQPHNMDKLLHRGQYAVESEDSLEGQEPRKKVNWLLRLIGLDEHFTRMDRIVTIGIFGWSMFWFLVFAVGTIIYKIHPWSNETWALYWLWTAVYLPLLVSVVTTIWFTIGCWQDMWIFFRKLRTETVDLQDDGTVSYDDEDRLAQPTATVD